jgi:hypothetical protein
MPPPLGEVEWWRLWARHAARPPLGEDSVAVIRAMRDGEP